MGGGRGKGRGWGLGGGGAGGGGVEWESWLLNRTGLNTEIYRNHICWK